MVTDQSILNEISLLEAHATKALEIAARLRKKIAGKSEAETVTDGLSKTQVADIIAKKRKHLKTRQDG